MNKLPFVKSISNPNYRLDQKELIDKAIKITDNKLDALNYIATAILHETGESVDFTLVINIPANTVANITLPIIENGDKLGYYVFWGDGHITHNINTHTYTIDKEYIIRFFGLGITGYGSLEYNNIYLTKVLSFGQLGSCFTSLEYAFNGCINLSSVPDYLPNTIVNLDFTFNGCLMFNQNLQWDTSNITSMCSTFGYCNEFNQNLAWDTTNVIDFEDTFYMCSKFNQKLQWNVINAKTTNSMFWGCVKFNQDLEWDTSNIINMDYMFNNCHKFNKQLNWDCSNVITAICMFSNCTDLEYDLKIHLPNIENNDNMFKNCKKYIHKL
jgi:hypothetical protein